MDKKVLFLGASGLIGPHITTAIARHCDLRLADVKPHPDGTSVDHVDVTNYQQVLEATRGMDAVMNFTVVRADPIESFKVNTIGAWHVMKAAAAHGITRVVHSGPQQVRAAYEWDFDVSEVPLASNSNYYGTTKYLAGEICRIMARTHRIHTVAFVFAGLGAAPTEVVAGEDIHPFRIFWEDLQLACKLALEIPEVPDYYQEFNMHSCDIQGKYLLDKARKVLGFEPVRPWNTYYKRVT